MPARSSTIKYASSGSRIVNQVLQFGFALQDGDEVIAHIFGNAFLHAGDDHASYQSWNIFEHRQLIQLEVCLPRGIFRES